jgi:hypothetical protein
LRAIANDFVWLVLLFGNVHWYDNDPPPVEQLGFDYNSSQFLRDCDVRRAAAANLNTPD